MFEAGSYYHIFNRTNNNELLFRCEENYRFFLQQYQRYLGSAVNTLAYCLMPTHFHFFVQVKEERCPERLPKFPKLRKSADNHVDKSFKNFFISYAKAFNKMYHRHGSIFQPKYKKKCVDDDDYYTAIIAYIHLNPVEAQLCKRPEDWIFSSYLAMLSDKPTEILREQVLNWFGGKNELVRFHRQYRPDERVNEYLLKVQV